MIILLPQTFKRRTGIGNVRRAGICTRLQAQPHTLEILKMMQVKGGMRSKNSKGDRDGL